HGDIELRLEITDAVLFQFEVAIPRHRSQGPMEERVGVVPETRQARVVDCHQSATGNWGAVQRKRPESATREVGLEDQRVVAGAKNEPVKDRVHAEARAWGAHPSRVLLDAPRVQLLRAPRLAESSERPVVFRQSAENGTRDACAPSSTFVYAFTQDQPDHGIGCRSNREGSNKVFTPSGAVFTEPRATRPSRICSRAKPSRCLT